MSYTIDASVGKWLEMGDYPVGERFQVAGGSVCGRDHIRAGRGSQDAMWWGRGAGVLVAVVCDGCGSGRHSEVGARLGARLVVRSLLERLTRGDALADPALWRRVRDRLLRQLGLLAGAMGGDRDQLVADHFLFTVVGAALTPTETALFAVGDGLYAVNGEVALLGPFPDNQPPYLGYGLLDRSAPVDFQLHELRPTAEVNSLLVATDGAVDLHDAAAEISPGTGRPVGPLAQFWTDDLCFRNPDVIRRRLALANRDQLWPDWEQRRLERSAGLLGDDTTLVAIRRAPWSRTEGKRWPA